MATIGVVVLVVVVLAILYLISNTLWFAGRTADTARDELDPKELLRKYEWFKNTAAQLDKKAADIKVYEKRIKIMDEDFAGEAKKDWPRSEREQYNLWLNEVAGVISSYNLLAAEYNSQMSKINWKFTNVGDLPEGAEEPLPREFREYISE